jgi:hypothetical protein
MQPVFHAPGGLSVAPDAGWQAFRRFDVTCLRCGSYDLRLATQMDKESDEMAVVLDCKKCRQREILAFR